MTDRVLCGSRIDAASYETDHDHDLAPRMIIRCCVESDEILEAPLADDVEILGEWLCKNGQTGELVGGEGIEAKPVKSPWIHRDIPRERRSIEEFDMLLDEYVDLLRKRRCNAARLLKAQKEVEEAEKNT